MSGSGGGGEAAFHVALSTGSELVTGEGQRGGDLLTVNDQANTSRAWARERARARSLHQETLESKSRTVVTTA